MIDIHTHIMPGIDDGAIDICDTLEMLRMAAAGGTDMIVATPHCNCPGMYENYFGNAYIETYERMVKAVRDEGINISICPGMEVFVTPELPDLIVNGKIMPLNQSRYVLVEFAMDEEPEFANVMLRQIRSVGAKPVIAHVERYEFVQDKPQIVQEWRNLGYPIQCNKASFSGKFGKKPQKTASYLLNQYWVSVIASDAHGVDYRTTDMMETYKLLERKYSEQYLKILFDENPRRICENLPILNLKLVAVEENDFG